MERWFLGTGNGNSYLSLASMMRVRLTTILSLIRLVSGMHVAIMKA
jgi:hypothetical protein